MISLIPTKTISSKKCPFILNKSGYPHECFSECMAWTVVQEEITIEDNNDKDILYNMAKKYKIKLIKSSSGSTGLWIIPELGYCKRLWPNLDNVISPLDCSKKQERLYEPLR